MTTSLPTTSPTEIFPGATAPLSGSTPLADGFAALFAPASASAPTSGVPALAPEFTALLDGNAIASAAPATASANPIGMTAQPVLPAGATTAPRVVANAQPATAGVCTAEAAANPPAMPTDVRGFAFTAAHAVAETVATSPSETETVESAVSSETETAAGLPDRATLEAIVALLTPLAVAASQEQPVPVPSPDVSTADEPDDSVLTATDLPDSGTGARAVVLPARTEVTFARPGQPAIALDETLSPTPPTTGAAETFSPVTPKTQLSAREPLPPSAPIAAAAPASAPVPVARAATPSPAIATPEIATPDAPAATDLPTIETVASVELADGAVVAMTLPKISPRPMPRAVAATESIQAENSAAVSGEKIAPDSAPEISSGKNFLSTTEQQLSPEREKAGIGVAKTRPTMLFFPHDSLPTVHPTVPALVSVVSAGSQPSAAPAAEPMPQLVAASLAHRAVEAVTSVVDAQAASKLQPVPSVQLKFKVGTEDLAVRVALRDGVVHTEFRTDSPELRAAIQHEWQAVAAQPESALRFLEPVVSAASSSSQSGTNSFAQQQQQQSPGQSAAQQQQQQQQHQQTRAAAEFFGSVARSTPFQPREGGAASSSLAAVLPTSVHLSAVA